MNCFVLQEIENAYNTAGLTVQLLLEQAEIRGCDLQLNISQLENEALLGELTRVPYVVSKGLLPIRNDPTVPSPISRMGSKQLPALISRNESANSEEISKIGHQQEIDVLKVCSMK